MGSRGRRPAVATFGAVTGAKVRGKVRNDGVDRYLKRIGYTGVGAPTINTLRKLQLGHLINVPFENLDVFHRRGVRVDVNWSFQKIVVAGAADGATSSTGASARCSSSSATASPGCRADVRARHRWTQRRLRPLALLVRVGDGPVPRRRRMG